MPANIANIWIICDFNIILKVFFIKKYNILIILVLTVRKSVRSFNGLLCVGKITPII